MTDTATTTADDSAQDQATDDPAAERDRLREELIKARKWEQRAKENAAAAKELEQFRQQSMTDTEKAVDAARNEGRAEGARTASERIARAEIRAAAAGRNVDVEALLEGVDPKRFLDDDGEPDTKAIAAWMDRVAPAAKESEQAQQGWPDLGQGVRSVQSTSLGDPLLRDLKRTLGI